MARPERSLLKAAGGAPHGRRDRIIRNWDNASVDRVAIARVSNVSPDAMTNDTVDVGHPSQRSGRGQKIQGKSHRGDARVRRPPTDAEDDPWKIPAHPNHRRA